MRGKKKIARWLKFSMLREEGKVVTVRAIKAHRGRYSIALLILNLGALPDRFTHRK